MSTFNCWSRISMSKVQNNIALPYIFSVGRSVSYKDPYEPSVESLSMKWYNSLAEPFKFTHTPTAPTYRTGLTSFAEFARDYSLIDSSLLDVVDEWMDKMLFSIDVPKVYSDDEVLGHMVKTTSAGFPFKMEKQKFIYHSEWNNHINYVYDQLDNNFDPFLWQWSQKYELRPLEKARLGKIRGFCVSPVDHCFLSSKYFADFNEKFYELSGDPNFPSAVGMSKYNGGFNELALNLLRFPNIYYSDFSKFDTTITPQLLYDNFLMKMKIINLSPLERKRVEKLAHSVIFSKVVLEDGNIHVKQGGNPSGQTNTIVDNTLINIKLFYLCFLIQAISTGNARKATLAYIRSNMFLKCYGDDAIMSFSDDLNLFFNGKVIEQRMLELGFLIKINHEPCGILEAEFLSHKFVRYGEVYLPCLDEDKVLSSLVKGAYNDNPLYCLMRALSLRVESWPSLRCRAYIRDYIRFCYSECQQELQGYYELAEDQRIDLESLKQLWFTDKEILDLYVGFEGNGSVLNKFSQFKNHYKIFKSKLNVNVFD